MGGFVTTLEFCVMCVLLSFGKIECATFDRQSSLSVPSSSSSDHGSNQSTGAEKISGRKLFSTQTQTVLFPSVWEAILDAGMNPHRYNLSADCYDSLRDYSQGYTRRESWAVRMFDSSGKPAPGMMMGGLTQFGNYDECLNLRHYPELAQNRMAHVRGTQYCSVFFTIPDWMVQFFSSLEVPYPVKLTRVTVDLCVPRTCTTSDIHSLVSQYVSSDNNNNITAEEGVNCFQPELFSEDAAAIVVVFLLSLILLLVFLGTCLDLVLRMNQNQAVSGPVSEVGLRRRSTSRLSRFGSSFYHHWKRIGSGKGREEISPKRRNTIGYRPSIIRRISNSVVGKYATLDNDPDNPPDPSTIDKTSGETELTRKSSMKGGPRNSQASGVDVEVTYSLSKKGGGQDSHAVPCGDQGMAQLTMVKRLLSEDGEPRGRVGAQEKRAQSSANDTQRLSNGVIPSDAQRDTTNLQCESDKIGDPSVQPPLSPDSSVAFNVQTGEVYMTANTNSNQHSEVSPRSEYDRSTNDTRGQTNDELRDCEECRVEDPDTSTKPRGKDSDPATSVNTPPDCDNPPKYTIISISKADSAIQEKLIKDGEQTQKETDEGNPSAGTEKKATDEKLSSSATAKAEGCGVEHTTSNTETEDTTAGRSEMDKKPKAEGSAQESSAPESSCASLGAVDAKGKSRTTDEQAAESSGGREPETVGKQTPETTGKQALETTGKQTPETTGKQTPETTGKQTPETTGKQALETTGKQALETTGIQGTQAFGSEQTPQSIPQQRPDIADKQTTETTRKETLENTDKQGLEGTGKQTLEATGRQTSEITESKQVQDPTGVQRSESAHKNIPETTESKQIEESSGTQETGKQSEQASETSSETTRTQTAQNTETVTANGTPPIHTEQVTLQVETNHQNTVTQSPHDSRHSHPSTPHQEDSLTSSPVNERYTSPKLLRFHDEQDTTNSPTLTTNPNLSPSTKPSTIPNTTRKPQIRSPKLTCSEADDNTPQPKTPHHTPSKGGLLSIPEESGVEKNNSALHYRKSGCKSLPVNNNDDNYKDEEDDGGVRWRYRHESDGSELEAATKDVEGGKGKQEAENPHSLVAEVLLSFSFLRSVRKVMGEGNADHLFSLNGVRVLSICWIVLGNTMAMLNKHPTLVANKVDTAKMAQTMWFQAVMNGTFAADTFFILSGCLVCYHFLRAKSKQLQEKPGTRVLTVKAVLLFYLHRIMRILPCYYVVLLSYTTLTPYLGEGSYWSSTDHALRPCRDHWWANALFFSNFYQPQDMCMSWSYYLVNDIQMYLLSPLVLYPLLFLPQVGLLLLVLLVAIQIITTVLLTDDCNGNLLSLSADFFATVYAKPYCRVGAFAIGMGLGYFLHSTRRQIFFRKMPLILGWLTSLGVVGTVVYVTQEGTGEGAEGWTVLQCALYQAFSRPAWCLAVSFIIFVCSIGQGGFVYRLLSWNAFLPLCRITYGVYLLHPVLITVVLNGSQYPIYSTFGTLIYQFVSNLVCAYGLAFFLITLVETPFTSLEAVLRARCR